MNFSIAVHGGAGTILRQHMTPELQQQYLSALDAALRAGEHILSQGGSSLDAVEAAVVVLEDFPLFNAGKGSVFNHIGGHEMDASIMDGRELGAGAVSGVSQVRNPVKLARIIMEQSEHVMLFGKGAEEFAKSKDLDFEHKSYFYNETRYRQWQEALEEGKVVLDHTDRKFGTVGAVAYDAKGNLAAATSTGGMTNKKFGRIGDSPIIGAGTYANNNTCAVSCTGHGELFIRSVVGHDISCLIEYKGLTLEEACRTVVHEKLVKIGGEGGLIAIDKNGHIAMPFNSDGMYRGCLDSEGRKQILIYKD
ncbi:MAG: isoaspartyl peptidase/L-asparaginase [Sphingobacteriales bacterium]|nr:MAG: isoaspartyl peptidase/L-asparaginase [Sphingobacteriales bacterium]